MKILNLLPISGLTLTLSAVLVFLAVGADARKPPQPIGIDFGPQLITAAYAHAADNVSIIAVVRPDEDDPYPTHMFRLRMEYVNQKGIDSLWGYGRPGSPWSVTQVLSDLAKSFISEVTSRLTFLEDPAIENSWVLSHARDMLILASQAVSFIHRYNDPLGEEIMTLDKIKDGFVRQLLRIKEEAAKDSDIDFDFATLAVPDFFNKTLWRIVQQASLEAGINSKLITRDIATILTPTFKLNGNPGLNYLFLDQQMYSLDLCTMADGANQRGEHIRNSYLPIPHFGTASIDRDVADRLVSGSEELQVAVHLGAHKNALWAPIRKARLLIRDDLDTELSGGIADEDHHLDEYPLELNGWSGNVQAVLSWEDVHAAETKYVEAVGQNLRTYLSALRQIRIPGSSTDEEIPERIDKVVILTDGTDGRLLKRAVHKALGEHIEIIGGTVHGFYLAAFGAARRALMYRNSWYEGNKKTSAMKGVSVKHNDLYQHEL